MNQAFWFRDTTNRSIAMSIAPILRTRVLVMFALALVLAVSAYGFAAANTFANPTALGDGSQTISGYAVSNVKYTLDAAVDPATITTVTFDLAGTPVAKYAKVQLVATTGDVYPCVVTGSSSPATATCAIAGAVTGAAADTLHVVASSDLLP